MFWRGCSLSTIQTSRVLQEVTSRWPASSGQAIRLRKAEVDPSLLTRWKQRTTTEKTVISDDFFRCFLHTWSNDLEQLLHTWKYLAAELDKLAENLIPTGWPVLIGLSLNNSLAPIGFPLICTCSPTDMCEQLEQWERNSQLGSADVRWGGKIAWRAKRASHLAREAMFKTDHRQPKLASPESVQVGRWPLSANGIGLQAAVENLNAL